MEESLNYAPDVWEYDEREQSHDTAFMLQSPRVNNETDLYCLDSGCTISQTNDLNQLEEVHALDRVVEMANRQRLRTVAQGRLGVVKNVSYTPGIKKLLSERSLIKQGYGIVKLSLQHADIICRTTGKLKGRAYSTNNGLWMIDPLTIKPLDDEVIAKHPEYAMTSSLKDEDAFDHYQNIMFMPQNAMKQLKEQRAVEGFKVSMKSLNEKRPLNTASILGSMTRNPVRRKKMMKQKPPIGHTIIADVYGKYARKV